MSSPGSESFIQHTEAEGWSVQAISRIALEGSTANTSKPLLANQAASRPVPDPTSSTRAGGSGSRSVIQSCRESGLTDSYFGVTALACLLYQATESFIAL